MVDIPTDILLGSAYASSTLSTRPNYGFPVSADLLLSAWVIGFILNVSVTLAIAGRLWWMGRTMASLTSTSTGFVSSIYIVVESGALSAVANTVVLALYADPAALTGLDVASQLVVCVRPSFSFFRLLGPFVLAGIGTTLDHRAGWVDRPISFSKRVGNSTNSTGQDRIPSKQSPRGGPAE